MLDSQSIAVYVLPGCSCSSFANIQGFSQSGYNIKHAHTVHARLHEVCDSKQPHKLACKHAIRYVLMHIFLESCMYHELAGPARCMLTWQLIYTHLLHPFLFCFAFRIPAIDDAAVVVPSMANDIPNLEMYHARAGTPGLPAWAKLN